MDGCTDFSVIEGGFTKGQARVFSLMVNTITNY